VGDALRSEADIFCRRVKLLWKRLPPPLYSSCRPDHDIRAHDPFSLSQSPQIQQARARI